MKEAILVVWGILRDGRNVLLSMRLGKKEFYDDWLEILRDMVKRGLRVPLSVTPDGVSGLIRAIREVFPKSIRIRCWVHKMKNLSSKVSESEWPEIRAEIVMIRDAVNYEEGKRLAERFTEKWNNVYPTANSKFQ